MKYMPLEQPSIVEADIDIFPGMNGIDGRWYWNISGTGFTYCDCRYRYFSLPLSFFYILTYSYLHFYLCYPIRCLTCLFHLSHHLLLLHSHFHIFWILLTDYSQSLPPYPTESKSYLYTFILYSLLTIISHGRYI